MKFILTLRADLAHPMNMVEGKIRPPATTNLRRLRARSRIGGGWQANAAG
jgi:hypothetical protein